MGLQHLPRDAIRLVRRALGHKPPPPEDLGLIISCLQPGHVFVDVGANVGLYSLAAAQKVGPDGLVLAIEPNPDLLGQLQSTTGGMSNVRIVPVAVGDAFGDATLYLFKQHTRSSLLRGARADRYTMNERNRVKSITVPVEPLLAILVRCGVTAVDVLKIDIEGYEDRALIPFFEAAPERLWPRRVLIERSPNVWKEDCIARMRGRGYSVVWEGRGDTLLSLVS